MAAHVSTPMPIAIPAPTLAAAGLRARNDNTTPGKSWVMPLYEMSERPTIVDRAVAQKPNAAHASNRTNPRVARVCAAGSRATPNWSASTFFERMLADASNCTEAGTKPARQPAAATAPNTHGEKIPLHDQHEGFVRVAPLQARDEQQRGPPGEIHQQQHQLINGQVDRVASDGFLAVRGIQGGH